MLMAGDESGSDLLQQRADMARRLRHNLSDPDLRKALRAQCAAEPASALPDGGSGVALYGAGDELETPSSRKALPSKSCFIHTGASTSTVPRGNVTARFRGSAHSPVVMRRSSSAGSLRRPATARAEVNAEGWRSQSRCRQRCVVAPLNSKPIPLRGAKANGASSSDAVSDSEGGMAGSTVAGAVTSDTFKCFDGRFRQDFWRSHVSGAESACSADMDGLELQMQLQAARDRLVEIESERRLLIDSSIDLLARSTSRAPSGIQTPVSPAPSGVASAGPVTVPLTPGAATMPSVGRASPPRGTSPQWQWRAPPARSRLGTSSTVDDLQMPPFSRHSAPEDASPAGMLSGGNSTDGLERPEWLMADGRLLTACLEGENRALRRAVARAKVEIDEMVKRRSATEDRARSLAEENQAAAHALRRLAGPGAATRPGAGSTDLPEPSGTAVAPREADAFGLPVDLSQGVANDAVPGASVELSTGPTASSSAAPSEPPSSARSDAAASLRKLVLLGGAGAGGGAAAGEYNAGSTAQMTPAASGFSERPEHPAPAAVQVSASRATGAVVEATPRRQLLERSEEIGRRMEEILSRRGKLHQVLDSASEQSTDAGSSSAQGAPASSSSAGLASPPADRVAGLSVAAAGTDAQ